MDCDWKAAQEVVLAARMPLGHEIMTQSHIIAI